MNRSQAATARIDRLVGDGKSVAGIDLATLFRVILNHLQDSPHAMTSIQLEAVVREAISNHARIVHLYGGYRDPWAALIGDALTQLEARKLAQCDDRGLWHTGAEFRHGERMQVIPSRRGKHKDVGVILYTADERKTRADAEILRMEVTSIAARLREDGPGLCPLNPHRIEALAQSMRDYGYWPTCPVIVDQERRILDGRHRRAAARKADVEEVAEFRVYVASDAEAVGRAINYNLGRWSKDERARINDALRMTGLTIETFGSSVPRRPEKAGRRSKKTGLPPEWYTREDLRSEIRMRLVSGQPVTREDLMAKLNLSQSTVRAAIRFEQAMLNIWG